MSTDEVAGILSRLDRLDERMNELRDLLIQQRKVKDWYSTAEVATLLGKAEFTVREWCRHKRIRARKRDYRRGKSAEWMISHEELLRVQNQGLLPVHEQ